MGQKQPTALPAEVEHMQNNKILSDGIYHYMQHLIAQQRLKAAKANTPYPRLTNRAMASRIMTIHKKISDYPASDVYRIEAFARKLIDSDLSHVESVSEPLSDAEITKRNKMYDCAWSNAWKRMTRMGMTSWMPIIDGWRVVHFIHTSLECSEATIIHTPKYIASLVDSYIRVYMVLLKHAYTEADSRTVDISESVDPSVIQEGQI